MTRESFFKVLFDLDEQTCFGKNVYATALGPVFPVEVNDALFFSINPMKDKRADANITTYRNVLIEFDTVPPGEQMDLLAYVPLSTLLWSGGKSYHAVISLEEPLRSRDEYDRLVRRIQRKLPLMDKSTGNPSRFSRMPGGIRDSGQVQRLIEVRTRISSESIEAWLGPEPQAQVADTTEVPDDYIPPWTRSYLRLGSNPGSRNRDLFKAACDLVRAGLEFDEIYELTAPVADLNRKEMILCIRSAIKTVCS